MTSREPEESGSPELDQRTLAAYHEAGHAVAAVMRMHEADGLRESPTIRADGSGLTLVRIKGGTGDGHFITYAGPWAEARYLAEECAQKGHYECALGGPGDGFIEECLDEYYLPGMMFGLAVAARNEPDTEQASDWEALQRPHPLRMVEERLRAERGDARGMWWEGDTEQIWRRELGSVWPAIAQVAELLLAGQDVPGATVDELLDQAIRAQVGEPGPETATETATGSD